MNIFKEKFRWGRIVSCSLLNFYLPLVIFILSDPAFETLFSVHYAEGQHGESNMNMTPLGISSSSLCFSTLAFSVWPHLSKPKCSSRTPPSLGAHGKDRDKLLSPGCPLGYVSSLLPPSKVVWDFVFASFVFAYAVFLQASHLNGNLQVGDAQ